MKIPKIVGIVLFIILLSTALVHYSSEKEVEYEKIKLEVNVVNSRTLDAMFARAEDTGNNLPGIVVFHGFSANKEMMRPFVEELALNGFAVLAVSLQGHGMSSGSLGEDGDNSLQNDGVTAVNYLKNRSEVDETRIGLLGHSMGASTAFATSLAIPSIMSNVFIGNSLTDSEVNTTNPKNMLMAIGTYEELFSVDEAVETLERAVGSTVSFDTLYGNFVDGTARKIIAPTTDHVFEVGNPEIIEESVKWLYRSLNNDDPDFENNSGWKNMGEAMLSVFAALSWLSLFGIAFYYFKEESDEETVYTQWVLHGALTILSFIFGAVFLVMGLGFEGVFVGWFIFGTVFFAITLMRKMNTEFSDVVRNTFDNPKESLIIGFYAFLLVFIPIQLILHNVVWDFRYVLPVLSKINMQRFLLMVGIWIPGSVYFTLETKHLDAENHFGFKSLWLIILARNWPFMIILAIQYIPIMLFGTAVLPNSFGFLAFFLVGQVPVMIILSVFTVIGKYCNIKPLSQGIVLAGYIAWVLASTLPL